MRLLIITHGYAPAVNARAFRWTALAEFWAAAGHEIDVITVRSGGSSRSGVVNGVRVHRVGFYFEKLGVTARQSSHNVKSFQGGDGKRLGAGVKRVIMRTAKKLHDLTWKTFYWPDYAAPWIPFAVIAARRIIVSQRPTAVISVSLPFSSHVAALLAGTAKRKIPWIVDVGDPFSFMTATPTNNHNLYSSINVRSERTVFGKANAVTVTTASTRAMYEQLFGHTSKIIVIPPMLSVSIRDFRHDETGQHTATRLVYIGTLNRNIRSPDRLLALFDALVREGSLPDVHLDFYGETGDCGASFERLPPGSAARVHVHGLVSRDKALEASRSAAALINIGNTTSYQLPSKLVEYVAAGRPIVNLASGGNDSSVEFLDGVPGVLTLMEDSPIREEARILAEFLRKCVQAPPERVSPAWLSQFSVNTVASSYETVITESSHLAVARDDRNQVGHK